MDEKKKNEQKFWEEAWVARQLGFHQKEANPHLVKYYLELQQGLKPTDSIFFPLCGKSLDLRWPLSAQPPQSVVGIEFVAQAVEEFFAENKLACQKSSAGELSVYQHSLPSNRLTIFRGDFFALTPEHLDHHSIKAIFDRAALVALPPETRVRYVQHLRKLFASQKSGLQSNSPKLLLISFEHSGGPSYGPPYSVSEAEVRRLYAGLKMEKLFEEELATESSRLNQGGVSTIQVKGYLIQL